MSEQFTIRAMTARDLPEVVAIEEASFSGPWSAQGFAAAIERSNVAAYVYVENRRVLGYFMLNFNGPEAHIMNLAVHTDHRRRSIASRCLEFANRVARRRDALRITLEVEESNLPAQLLYRKAGYRATRILRNYYSATNEDGYRMVRALAEPARAAP